MSHKRHIDGRDRRHGHRAATPVRSAIQVLPDIFRLKRVAPDETRNQVIAQVGGNGQLAPIQSCVSQAVDAFVGRNLQGDEVSSGTTDEHLCFRNLHRDLLRIDATECNEICKCCAPLR